MENQAPCPNCGAPSPLLQIPDIGQWGTNNSMGGLTGVDASFSTSAQNIQTNSWGAPATSFNIESSWGQTSTKQQSPSPWQPVQQQSPSPWQSEPVGWDAAVPQIGFDTVAAPSDLPWSQSSPVAPDQNLLPWQDVEAKRQESPAAPQSLLPMVYQGDPVQGNGVRQSTVSLQLIPENAIEQLLPSMVAMPEGVYVAPLYTKPRPLVPKYRIISGFISVIVVALLLCTGAGYYAKTSGKLDAFLRIFTGAPPHTITAPTTANLPNPPDKIDSGPATSIIPSGTTTLRIDNNNIALEVDRVFTVNQTFYVTYSVQPPTGQDGTVSVKWYMNGQLYRVVTSDKVIKGGTIMNGSVQMKYAQAAEGSVEIDWNNQLGERFYFVVR
jgi:hypothetical protein